MDSPPAPQSPGLPLVVQIGFAGSRRLFDRQSHPTIDLERFERAVAARLKTIVERLKVDLNLGPQHFLCGVSQLAPGADMAFARVCQELEIPQRLFLPDQRDDYLASQNDGSVDFNEQEREWARELFESDHVIEERVASDAPDGADRFDEVNVDIALVSDIVICLLREDAEHLSETTSGDSALLMLAHADKRRRPLLELRVAVGEGGTPVLSETWRNREAFIAPALPNELAELKVELNDRTDVAKLCRPLRALANRKANWLSRLFRAAALVVIGAHVIATALAAIALKVYGWQLAALLAVELVLLAVGFGVHYWLHRAHAARAWAMAELAAEVGDSVTSLLGVAGRLNYLFQLPLPPSLVPLAETLNVAHLQSARDAEKNDWRKRRDRYVETRLAHSEGGQIAAYASSLARAKQYLLATRIVFSASAAGAALAAGAKLSIALFADPKRVEEAQLAADLLGLMTVILPTIAVAGLSLASAFDLEARANTYGEMLAYLKKQLEHLRQAEREREFTSLAIETETRLLGAAATSYSRRAYKDVG